MVTEKTTRKNVPKNRVLPDPFSEEREEFKKFFIANLVYQLELHGVPKRRRISLLSEITGRKTQTASNWLSGEALPDLDAARRIFFSLQLNADEMLGINKSANADNSNSDEFNTFGLHISQLLKVTPELEKFTKPIGVSPTDTIIVLQDGDEMAPDICRGETFGVDTSKDVLESSGLYLLEKNKRPYVRRVERKLGGTSVRLHCTNTNYESSEIPISLEGKLRGINIVGQVVFIVKRI